MVDLPNQPDMIRTFPVRFSALRYAFYAFPFLAVISPTGAFYGIDLKLGLLVVMMAIGGFALLRGPVFALFGLVMALAAYSVALGNEPAWILQHGQAIAMWIVASLLGVVSLRRGATPTGYIMATVIGIVVYAIIKAIVLALYFSGQVGFWPLILSLEEITGHRFVAWEGSGFRLTASNENIAVFFPFFVSHLRKNASIGTTAAALIVAASAFILITSNSRLLFVIAAAYVLIYFKSLYFRLLVLPLGSWILIDRLIERFQNQNAEMSDRIRTVIFDSMMDGLAAAPFFGHGLGWFSPYFVRFDYRPWLYELQILSTAAQIGIFGSALLYAAMAAIMAQVRVPPASYLIFGTILFMSLFNSFLFTISSSAAMMIAFSLARRPL